MAEPRGTARAARVTRRTADRPGDAKPYGHIVGVGVGRTGTGRRGLVRAVSTANLGAV